MDAPDHSALTRLRAARAVLVRQNDADCQAVADGLDAYLTGDVENLDVALALKPDPGQRRPTTRERLVERDALLVAAATRFWPSRNPSEQARELHRAMSRYEAAGWRREQHRATCPEMRAGTVEAVAFEYLAAGNGVISTRRIRSILATS